MQEQKRFGKPRTDAERKKRHQQRYGTTNLPPRGTGKKIDKKGKKKESAGFVGRNTYSANFNGKQK
jgi:hypothetical protein